MKYTTLPLNRAHCLLKGRSYFGDGSSLVFPWSMSGVSFRFTGTGAVVHFHPYEEAEPAYLCVWMDGRRQKCSVVNGNEKILIEAATGVPGMEDKPHRVTIIRVTEGMTPVRIREIALAGNAPRPSSAPVSRRPLIEFVGDSITCGYGVLGPAEEPGFHTFEEDATWSYAYRTAEKLHADISVAGASGKGVVSNCLGDRKDMTLRQAFRWADRQGRPYDFSTARIPDVVVVNAGTNDAWGGVTDDEFIPAAMELMGEIRAVYPETPIVYCYGVMDTTKKNAIEKAVRTFSEKDPNVCFHFTRSMSEDARETGGGGHPNTRTSERVSDELADLLHDIIHARKNRKD